MYYFIERELDWGMSCNEITVDSKPVSVAELGYYYLGIHEEFTFNLKVAKRLCFTGLERVVRDPMYNRQADVDKVFFSTLGQVCEPFLVDWVNDWKEVYRQFGSSRLPFWRLILTDGTLALPKQIYKRLQEEVMNIKKFFSILNMPGAVGMIVNFVDRILRHYERELQSTPKVYPFALAGKPTSAIPGASETPVGMISIS